jgi:hypothetical protein
LIETDRDRKIRVFADDANVATIFEIDHTSFIGRFDGTVLIKVGKNRKRRRARDRNTRHMVAICCSTLDGVEPRPFQADFEFTRDILPVKIRTGGSKLCNGDSYQYDNHRQHDHQLHYGLAALGPGIGFFMARV